MSPLLKNISQTYKNLYAPSINLVKKQIKMIPSTLTPQRQALDQAKKNAFRSIGGQAQEQGLFYSGYQPEKQGEYLGETYLPGIAEISNQGTQQRLTLLGALNELLMNQGKDVLGQFQTVSQRQAAERIARREIRAILEAAKIQ